MIKKIFLLGLTAALLGLNGASAFAQKTEERHADHEELRGMLKTFTDAFNSRNFDSLAPLLADHFSIITADQKRFTDLAAFKTYFNGYFEGDKARVKSVVFNPTADELTTFLDADAGVSHGTSADTYTFTDGESRTMETRWSAVVVKAKGRWKLASLHMGVDVLDNPVLAAAKGLLYKVGAAALVAGLLLGFFLAKAKTLI